MGYVPSYGWTISHDHLKNLLPAPWADLQHVLSRHGVALMIWPASCSNEARVSESEEAQQEIREALELWSDGGSFGGPRRS